jgi:hypothetical protein
LILVGVSGVGKSTVADAIGGIRTAAGFATAVVDTDALAQFGPPPQHGELRGSSFYDRLKCLNLGAVWANYRSAGARFVVISAGIDSAALRDRYVASLAGCEVQVVRLVAAARPDQGAEIPVDFTVVNDREVSVVAEEVIARAGW